MTREWIVNGEVMTEYLLVETTAHLTRITAIKAIEEYGFISPFSDGPPVQRIRVSSGKEFDLLRTEEIVGYREGDLIEYQGDSAGEYQWRDHPGLPFSWINRSLEERKGLEDVLRSHYILELDLEDCALLSETHNDIFEGKFTIEDYTLRMEGKKHRLFAVRPSLWEDRGLDVDKKIGHNNMIGFAACYERDGGMYLWLCGVLSDNIRRSIVYRRKGIASLLIYQQEHWAAKEGFNRLWFKTDNQYKPMMMCALKHGFDIVDMKYSERSDLTQIYFAKDLDL
ncbi:GNAT family N-acetyltransferase [Candidatus Woesearchaeota archaeon]|nr:GNAT family N-acetyltransferase [Candidatus Woesearchaeota archaeon]